MDLNRGELKALIKDAVREVLAEQRDFIYEIVEEALQDAVLSQEVETSEGLDPAFQADFQKLLEEYPNLLDHSGSPEEMLANSASSPTQHKAVHAFVNKWMGSEEAEAHAH